MTRDEFYSEEDDFGKTGHPGEVKSYEIGGISDIDSWKIDAMENGMKLEEYLEYWWNQQEPGSIPFIWQRIGAGYGFNGTTILKSGKVRFKDIWGQLMIDEYPPEK